MRSFNKTENISNYKKHDLLQFVVYVIKPQLKSMAQRRWALPLWVFSNRNEWKASSSEINISFSLWEYETIHASRWKKIVEQMPPKWLYSLSWHLHVCACVHHARHTVSKVFGLSIWSHLALLSSQVMYNFKFNVPAHASFDDKVLFGALFWCLSRGPLAAQ